MNESNKSGQNNGGLPEETHPKDGQHSQGETTENGSDTHFDSYGNENSSTGKIEVNILGAKVIPEGIAASDDEVEVFGAQIKNALETSQKTIDETIVDLCKSLSGSINANKVLKTIFFAVILLLIVYIFSLPLILVLIFRDIINAGTLLGSIIASIIELAIATLVLPRIIAEYLFDKEELSRLTKLLEGLIHMKRDNSSLDDVDSTDDSPQGQ